MQDADLNKFGSAFDIDSEDAKFTHDEKSEKL